MGQTVSLLAELDDLSLENGRSLLADEEFNRGRSKSNISCILLANSDTHKCISFFCAKNIKKTGKTVMPYQQA